MTRHTQRNAKFYLLGSASAFLMAAGAQAAYAADDSAAAAANDDLALVEEAQVQTQVQQQQQQQQADDENDLELEEIIVTGSRIAGAPGTQPSPVQIIDMERVKTSGFNNIADFLSDIPALQGSVVPDDTTGATLGASGLSLLNLRQLGTQRTLVLIDGYRQVGSQPGTAAVNVDTLNFLMVERTEVLTGGASSIYGADAVSGVVNFILKDDYEGFELDSNWTIDENGENQSLRISSVIGGNFADGRGNAMLGVEFRQNEEVLNNDLDFFNRDRFFTNTDLDDVTVDTDGDGQPDFAPSDGIPNFTVGEGGVLNIITEGGLLNNFLGAQFDFAPDGTPIPFDPGQPLPFSNDAASAGLNRDTQIGGTGVPLNDLTASLTPDSETINIHGKAHYDITDRITAFFDAKYTWIESKFTFQPSFFSGSPNGVATTATACVDRLDLSADDPDCGVVTDRVLPSPAQTFNIGAFTGTDNAFLDPAVGASIDNAFGIGGFQRFMSEFNRGQTAQRQTFRFVGGFRGDYTVPGLDKVWNWDVAFNFSRDTAFNRQKNSRLNANFFASVDAIRVTEEDVADVTAVQGASPFEAGDVICRLQLLDQLGLPTTINGVGQVDQNVVDNCVPSSIFGAGSISEEATQFIVSDLNDNTEQTQVDFVANVSGALVDPFGAGPIEVAMGYEYRREDSEERPDELPLVVDTFSNAIQASEGRFDVHEGYTELRVPVLRDVFLAQSLDITGSVRQSRYSTIGDTTAWAVSGTWRPVEDLVFRGGRARSIRAPNIGELFGAESQTFIQIDDPCSVENLDEDPSVAANRRRNCADLGIPVGQFVDPNPNISNPGSNSGNRDVQEEQSRTWFVGVTVTPGWFPNLVLEADFYDIEITDAIQAIGIQTIVDNCVDGNVIDSALCGLFERDPVTHEIVDFIQAPVNTAVFRTRGVDFSANYQHGLNDWLQPLFDSNFDFGLIRTSVSGTALLRLDDQTNPLDASSLDRNEGELGVPTYRFDMTTSWVRGPLTVNWEFNWQSSQRVFDEDSFFSTEDQLNSPFAFTGDFGQHDFNFSYDFLGKFSIRGGIVNAFDNDPPVNGENNIFDFFGRRFFAGATARF